jgi:signal transduction histidine kinase
MQVEISSVERGPAVRRLLHHQIQSKGMELSMCRSIIAVHGGRLFAEEILPQGATFHFTLPSHQEDAL